MDDLALSLGQTVLSQDDRRGIIRFIGLTSFAKGEWLGLELFKDSGKNDGSVNGQRYFECQPGFGIFIRAASVVEIIDQPQAVASTNVHAKPSKCSTIKPRSSLAFTGDSARKRQSLMGASAANATPGSRLSSRVRFLC